MNLNPETKVKETLHITRHWHSPEIRVAVHREGIEIEMSLEDFCLALAAEVGNPRFMFTSDTLKNKLMVSVDIVLNKVKEASAFV
jgi:hypothetical protein